MATQLKLEDVESALIEHIKNNADDGVFVDGISSENFDEDGSLAGIELPAMLVLFDDEKTRVAKDITRRNYQADQRWTILIGASNRSGTDKERNEALKLVSTARNFLAGQRLTVETGVSTEPIELIGSSRYQMDANGSWYSVKISIGTLIRLGDI